MHSFKTRSCYALALFILFISFTANAQFGIKAGIGVSDIVFSDEGQAPYMGYETDYLTHRYPLITYQVGLTAVLSINRHFDIQPEILFVKQGLKYDMQFIYDHIENRANIYYLQVPAAVRYSFSLEKQHHPNLFLGPYIGVKVHSKRIKTYDGSAETTKVENAKPVDFGLITGFGYDFRLKQGKITTEIRFGYSLIDIMEPQEGYVPEYKNPGKLKARNLSLTILVGYRLSSLFNKQKRS
jgi:hypothetical protein